MSEPRQRELPKGVKLMTVRMRDGSTRQIGIGERRRIVTLNGVELPKDDNGQELEDEE